MADDIDKKTLAAFNKLSAENQAAIKAQQDAAEKTSKDAKATIKSNEDAKKGLASLFGGAAKREEEMKNITIVGFAALGTQLLTINSALTGLGETADALLDIWKEPEKKDNSLEALAKDFFPMKKDGGPSIEDAAEKKKADEKSAGWLKKMAVGVIATAKWTKDLAMNNKGKLGLLAGLAGVLFAVLDPKKFMEMMIGVGRFLVDSVQSIAWFFNPANPDAGTFGGFLTLLMDNWELFTALFLYLGVKFIKMNKLIGATVKAASWIWKGLVALGNFFKSVGKTLLRMAIANPIALAIAAFVAIIAGIAAFFYLDDIKDKLGLDSLSAALPVLGGLMLDIFAKIQNWAIGLWNWLVDHGGGLILGMKKKELVAVDNEEKAMVKAVADQAARDEAAALEKISEDPNLSPINTSFDAANFDFDNPGTPMAAPTPIVASTSVANSSSTVSNTSVNNSSYSWGSAFMDTMRGPQYGRG